MSHNKLYGNTYKYILTGIDVASRYKVERPLRTKKSADVAEMVKDIFKAGPLRYPKVFQYYYGSEFKSDVTKLLGKKVVQINRATNKYYNTFRACVEPFNKVLAETLFKSQDARKLLTDRDSTWAK